MIEFLPLLIAFVLLVYLMMKETSKLVTAILSSVIGAIIGIYGVTYWFSVKMKGFLNF